MKTITRAKRIPDQRYYLRLRLARIMQVLVNRYGFPLIGENQYAKEWLTEANTIQGYLSDM